MKTASYNPSPLEVELAKGLTKLGPEIEKYLTNNKISSIENKIEADNPMVVIHTTDADGDPHEIVMKIIQRPDSF